MANERAEEIEELLRAAESIIEEAAKNGSTLATVVRERASVLLAPTPSVRR